MISFVAKLWASSFTLPPQPDKQTRRIMPGVIDYLYDRFSHVMVINDDAALDAWDDDSELDEWCINNNCYYLYDRVIYDPWMKRWYTNGIGGADHYFIVTNDPESFVYAQMVWG